MEITKKEILTKGLNTSQIIEEQSKKSGGKKLVEMVSELFNSEIQTHMFHLQTKSQSSFAEHMALGGYYTEIGEKLDGLIESYQGKYDIVKGYKSYSFEDFCEYPREIMLIGCWSTRPIDHLDEDTVQKFQLH